MLNLVSVTDADADEAHRKMSALLDEIVNIVSSNKDNPKKAKIKVKELITLAKDHFVYEEGIMDTIEFPFRGFHKAAHREILYALNLLKQTCCEFEYQYYEWLINSISNMLKSHVEHLDVTLFTYKEYHTGQV